ncbi:MAG: ATP synthase F1 subunit delta [Clostridium sp.]|nr:ATP synthase F1 subunit delta [Clostridium sp.]
MIKAGLTKRYAKALLELAQAKQQEAAFGRALQDFVELLQQNKELKQLICGKNMSVSVKKQLIEKLVGEDIPLEVKHFIFVILDKGREASLPEFATAYQEIYDEVVGVRQVLVHTAVPLAEKEQIALQAALAAKLNSEVRLKTAVDKELIGGLKVQIDDTVYDASLCQQLRSLKAALAVEE